MIEPVGLLGVYLSYDPGDVLEGRRVGGGAGRLVVLPAEQHG